MKNKRFILNVLFLAVFVVVDSVSVSMDRDFLPSSVVIPRPTHLMPYGLHELRVEIKIFGSNGIYSVSELLSPHGVMRYPIVLVANSLPGGSPICYVRPSGNSVSDRYRDRVVAFTQDPLAIELQRIYGESRVRFNIGYVVKPEEAERALSGELQDQPAYVRLLRGLRVNYPILSRRERLKRALTPSCMQDQNRVAPQ